MRIVGADHRLSGVICAALLIGIATAPLAAAALPTSVTALRESGNVSVSTGRWAVAPQISPSGTALSPLTLTFSRTAASPFFLVNLGTFTVRSLTLSHTPSSGKPMTVTIYSCSSGFADLAKQPPTCNPDASGPVAATVVLGPTGNQSTSKATLAVTLEPSAAIQLAAQSSGGTKNESDLISVTVSRADIRPGTKSDR